MYEVHFYQIKTRKEKHISQRELENMTGVKQSVIARMESGLLLTHM